MVGMLVSTTPFRLRVDASLSFADLLKQVKMKQGELIRHQKYPYNRIIPSLRERFGFTGALLPIFLIIIRWHGTLFRKMLPYNMTRCLSEMDIRIMN